MAQPRRAMLKEAAARGKYSPLYRHLSDIRRDEWRTTFSEIEELLGFKLPASARIHRPWWANQGERGGHSHALAWEMAGWKTSKVDLAQEALTFIRE